MFKQERHPALLSSVDTLCELARLPPMKSNSAITSSPHVLSSCTACQHFIPHPFSLSSLSLFVRSIYPYFEHIIMGNQQSVRHEPSPYSLSTTTCAPKPVKSALRRSESIKNDADTLSQLPDRTRYIPKMTAAKTSLILPTRPYGDASRDGVESPQLGYGFYMNLTPPTPEMYHPSYSKMQQQLHPRSNLGSLPIRSQQNHVFQSLQNKNAQQMGWTSVPI
jgi:hypothetical protein